MKAGTRALGVTESARGDDRSTLAGCVVRADRTVDGFAFGSCAVGGTDATGAVIDLFSTLDREDVRYLLLAGVAPAWFNLLDLSRIHRATERPVISVAFEASPGLEAPLREAFSGSALDTRLEMYRKLPPRHELALDDGTVFVRCVGCSDDDADEVVRAFTPEGGRPEPLRVARLAARAADVWRDDATT